MNKTTRQRLLIILLLCSILIATFVGFLYWQSAAVGLLALWAFSKKLLTVNGLILVAKKLPFLLLAGSKKLIIQTLSSLLLFSARTRFRWIRKLLLRIKLLLRRLLRKVRYHWNDMDLWEKALILISLIPVTSVVLLFFLLFAFVPRYLRLLLWRKAQESTAATVINKGVPVKARERVAEINSLAKNKIKKTLLPDNQKDPAKLDK